MITVIWRPGLAAPLDPDAIEDYRWDWSAWLGAATLAAITVSAADGITAAEITAARTATTCDIRVQAATVGAVHAVLVRADASDGRRRDCTLLIDCKQG